MAMPLSTSIPPRSLWTVADLEQLPADGNRYEILHGELLVTPMPAVRHQRISARLTVRVGQWCTANPGWEFLAPGGVVINETTWLEPDLAVYAVPAGRSIEDWRAMPPPALVIEILSTSTTKTDRHRKRPAYLAHGVVEVWLVDNEMQTVERWTAHSEFPQLHRESIAWAPTDGAPTLAIDVAELFTKTHPPQR